MGGPCRVVPAFTVLLLAGPLVANDDGAIFPTWTTPLEVSSGSSLRSEDVDADGVLDLIVFSSPWVELWRGVGDGSFTVWPLLQLGNGMKGHDMADLNGDGFIDVAAASPNSFHIALGFGLGDGTFSKDSTGVGAPPSDVAMGDLDADGDIDLAVTRWAGADVVSTSLNAGDGTFTAFAARKTGDEPFHISLADMDLDGDLDAITANSASDDVSVLLGHGTGAFATAMHTPMGFGPRPTSIMDWDLDGVPDVMTHATSTVLWLRGLGGGALDDPATLATLDSVRRLSVFDADRDGQLDLVVSAGLPGFSNAGGLLHVLQPGGGGSIAAASEATIPNLPYELVGDLDGDGADDLAAVSSGRLSTRLGAGDGTFWEPAGVSLPTAPSMPVVADLDHDGQLDVLVRRLTSQTFTTHFTVLAGLEGGALGEPERIYTQAGNLDEWLLADVTGDGLHDLIIEHPDGLALVPGLGGLQFGAPQVIALDGVAWELAAGEFNGDDDVDLLVVPGFGAQPVLLAGLGGGSFAPAQVVPELDGAIIRHVADLDADGNTDVVVSDGSLIGVYRARGDGSFDLTDFTFVSGSLRSVISAEVTEDAHLDLLVSSVDDGENELLIWEGTGAASFGASHVEALIEAGAIHAADATGDGVLDVLVQGQSHVDVLVGLGLGDFDAVVTYGLGPMSGMAVADMDADGLADVVRTDAVDDAVAVLFNQLAETWSGLGQALAGSAGLPSLLGTGGLGPDETWSVSLAHARPDASAWFVLGFGELGASFKGGVLVPQPDLVAPLPTGPAGAFQLDAQQPASVPSGVQLVMQVWISDPAGPVGFAASNGISGTTP